MIIKIPQNTVLAVWYDNAIIAVIQNPTREKIELAVREHNCYDEVTLLEPKDFDGNKEEKSDIKVSFVDDGDEFEGTVEITILTLY